MNTWVSFPLFFFLFAAPEIAEGRDDLSAAVDWWSMGVFLYHLITGKVKLWYLFVFTRQGTISRFNVK